jgi:hypothetical protein
MKTKFLLTLLALNGLMFGANRASAATESPTIDRHLTIDQKIATLIDLDPEHYSLMKLAIDRALIAQNNDSDSQVPVDANGAVSTMEAESVDADKQPEIRGRVAKPNPKPIIGGKFPKPNPTPIINGKIANPNPKPNNPPLINGLIINPDR